VKQLSKTHFNERLNALFTERSSWIYHWKDICANISPRSARFLRTDRNRGDVRATSIMNNTATMALRILTSGMMSGITSPARPWFKLRTANPDLNDISEVRIWLDNAEKVMSGIFLKSNLYTSLPVVYKDLGMYGTSCMVILEDADSVIHCMNFPIGSYMLGTNDKGQVDTVYRQYMMTPAQIVKQFGRPKPKDPNAPLKPEGPVPADDDIDWSNISPGVKSAYLNGNKDAWFDVVHVIEPNQNPDPSKLDARFKPYLSVYYEVGGEPESFLSVAGFNEFIAVCPRWELTGEDVYGTSPAMEALGDTRTLQLKEKRGAQLLDKFSNPAMVAPSTLRNKISSVLPGDVTYVDQMANGQTFQPAYQIPNPHQQDLSVSIQRDEARINTAFYKDLFLLIANDERCGITATEIAARQEEKLLALGPVYLRLNDELLDPLVERTFSIMMRNHLLPPAPQQMQGQELTVEYISIMAQTMKAIGMSGIEKVTAYVLGLLQADPTAVDAIDFDEAIRAYADMAGTPSKVIRDVVMVAQMRAQRQQQQQAQAQMQMMQQAADGVHKLGTTPADPSTALGQIVSQMRQKPGAAA
jgi:hypothetical protein